MRFTRRLWLAGWLVLAGLGFTAALQASQNVGLAWNPSDDENVAGYNVYYGTESGSYPFVLNVDTNPEAQLYGLVDGLTYYFAVSAVDFEGNESALSEEVAYSIPLPPPTTLQTQTLSDDNGQPAYMALTASTPEAGWWEMDYSTDLQTWSPYTYGYGTDAFVLVSLTDESQPQMFFRMTNYFY